jgi:hypothetical protein
VAVGRRIEPELLAVEHRAIVLAPDSEGLGEPSRSPR